MFVATGCAYFNTFYNARTHFKKAERIRRDRAEEGGPSQAAIIEYDATIEKCNKVIQQHSGSRWVDDALLLMGRAYLGKHEYVEALDKFEGLLDAFPESSLRDETLFMMGLTYYGMRRVEEGRRTFADLLVESPDFKQRDEMLRVQAQSLEDGGDVSGAVATYRQILREFPESKERVQTIFDIGKLYMEADRFDSALVVYQEAMGTADDFKQRLEAREYVGDALLSLRRTEEALETYLQVLDLGQNLQSAERVPVELKIAACHTSLGDPDRAIDDYTRITEEMPATVYAAESAYQIGLIWETHFGDYVKAVEFYASIGEMGGQASRSVYGEQAGNRKRELDRLIAIGITSPSAELEGDAEAEGAFLLAEHFLFEDSDTTKAIAQYADVAGKFSGTTQGAKASYARALLVSFNPAKADSADSFYVGILRTYPGTLQAIQAGTYLEERGLERLIPEGAMEPLPPPSEDDAAAAADSLVGAGVDTLSASTTEALIDSATDSLLTEAADSLGIAPFDSLTVPETHEVIVDTLRDTLAGAVSDTAITVSPGESDSVAVAPVDSLPAAVIADSLGHVTPDSLRRVEEGGE